MSKGTKHNWHLPAWITIILLLIGTSACGDEAPNEEQPQQLQCPADCSGHGLCGVVVTPQCWELNTCSDIPVCTCHEGYTGTACEQCAYGYVLQAGQCVADPVSTNVPPTEVSNPDPPDQSVGVDVDVTLEWICEDIDGDPLTYDVYFGTAQDPPLTQEGLTSPGYDPGGLDPGTQYYWYVVCKDASSEKRGPTWEFRTACRPPAPCTGSPTVTDDDGNVYDTVEICGQCWMAENLHVGHTIPLDNALGAEQGLVDDDIPYHFCPGNTSSCARLGGLYHWDELMNFQSGTRGVCPAGWHVPSDAEWQTLETNLGMSAQEAADQGSNRGTDQGTQLKEGGSAGFDAPYAGFASLFFGHFDFANEDSSAVFWTSTSAGGTNAWYRRIDANDPGIDRSLASKLDAHSVRCLQD